jgi:hypothetical protein
LILLEFGGTAASQSGVRSVNSDEFAFNLIKNHAKESNRTKVLVRTIGNSGSI